MVNTHRRILIIVIAIQLLLTICLFLYSYTQVDLNLTLSRVTFWFAVQDFFQHIGYFQRPLSTAFYGAILIGMFGIYSGLLYVGKRYHLKKATLWTIIIITVSLLVFSYPAFSYDLFNYMFDARIVTKYGQNPYLHKALDYPLDPWIQFMRWTHRTYPYGPFWLVLTVPLSFIGQHFFLPTMYLFKMLIASCYIGTIYYLNKIGQLLWSKESVLTRVIFFAFNPLVIIESLVSAHNDIVMMFFAVMSLYYLFKKNYIVTYVLLAISIGIKFATIFLIPGFVIQTYVQVQQQSFSRQKLITVMIIGMTIAMIAVTIRTQFQPWYLLYILPFLTFVADQKYILVTSSISTLAGLLMYVPFLYLGNWNSPVPILIWWITLVPVAVSTGVGLCLLLAGRKKNIVSGSLKHI